MTSLQQLRYLVAIADHENFSRAAEACNVTQPTLSMQLKELELQLEAQLVERTRAKVLMTPVGLEIAYRAKKILADVDDVRALARSAAPDIPAGDLRLGVVQTVGGYVLSLAIPELKRAYPDLKFIVREERLEQLPGRLTEGVYDVLLVPEKPEGDEFVSVSILKEPLHLVVPADHRLAGVKAVDPKDLAGETILSMERGHRIHEQIATLCREVDALHATDYAGTTLDTLRLMVTCGMGISLLPALYVRSDVQRETQVVSRPLSSGAPVRELTMSWRKSSPRHKAFQAVAEIIAGSISPWGLAR